MAPPSQTSFAVCTNPTCTTGATSTISSPNCACGWPWKWIQPLQRVPKRKNQSADELTSLDENSKLPKRAKTEIKQERNTPQGKKGQPSGSRESNDGLSNSKFAPPTTAEQSDASIDTRSQSLASQGNAEPSSQSNQTSSEGKQKNITVKRIPPEDPSVVTYCFNCHLKSHVTKECKKPSQNDAVRHLIPYLGWEARLLDVQGWLAIRNSTPRIMKVLMEHLQRLSMVVKDYTSMVVDRDVLLQAISENQGLLDLLGINATPNGPYRNEYELVSCRANRISANLFMRMANEIRNVFHHFGRSQAFPDKKVPTKPTTHEEKRLLCDQIADAIRLAVIHPNLDTDRVEAFGCLITALVNKYNEEMKLLSIEWLRRAQPEADETLSWDETMQLERLRNLPITEFTITIDTDPKKSWLPIISMPEIKRAELENIIASYSASTEMDTGSTDVVLAGQANDVAMGGILDASRSAADSVADSESDEQVLSRLPEVLKHRLQVQFHRDLIAQQNKQLEQAEGQLRLVEEQALRLHHENLKVAASREQELAKQQADSHVDTSAPESTFDPLSDQAERPHDREDNASIQSESTVDQSLPAEQEEVLDFELQDFDIDLDDSNRLG